MKNKTTIKLIMGMFILGVLMLSFASAEFWACFEKREKINYCASIPNSNYTRADETCSHDVGCQECMRSYYPEYDGGCYVYGSWPRCNSLPPECSDIGGETSYDLTPPVFKILSLSNGTIYSSRKIFLNFSLNEIADVYYRDLNKTTSTWTKVCNDCNSGNPSYARLRTFAEGENNLMFKAVDVVGIKNYSSVNFVVDSIKPRIYTTNPRANSFADGTFEVQFKEANPEKLTLYYGTSEQPLSIASCRDESGKKVCETSVNLGGYNGQQIQYYFEIEDIAGNKYKSRAINVKVDTKDPVVNNKDNFFTQGEGRYSKYINFNIDITEDNFYKVTYVNNNDPRLTERTLCSRLTNGFCVKKQSFLKGHYDLTIIIYDKAGHSSVGYPANFDINY